jgi:PAS domain S-box-containing protein
MYGTIQDIEDKVNHQAELNRLKNNQEAMINSTQDFMWALDLELNLITANTSFLDYIKRNTGESINEGDYIFNKNFDPEINNKWKDFYTRVLKGESFSVKQKILDPGKFLQTYNTTSFNPLYDKKGKQIGLTCFSKDITSEVLSQQVLLTAKEEMEKIMEASLDIICTMDEDGYFLSINKACKRIWGYNPKDLIGTNYIELVFEDDVDATEISRETVFSGKKETNFENRYKHKNGTLVPMLWSSNWDEKDCVYYCIARDNTEKKKAELKLENSERLFKTLVQESSDIITILDVEGNFKYVSPSSTKVIQVTPEEFMGRNVFEFIHPDDYDKVQGKFYSIFENEYVKLEPFRFSNKLGEWRWFEAIVTNQLNEPSINGIAITSRDITEKRMAEEQLETSERRFKTLVQEGSDMICIVDEQAIFSYASPTSTNILNITPEKFIGTSAFVYIHPNDLENVQKEFHRIFKEPQITIGPFRFKHGNGNWIWMETIVTNQLNEPSINGIVLNSKNVTTRVQHINAIKLQNAKLKEIAWSQSHIVRAPVARLIGLINLIKNENEILQSDEKEQILNFIFTSANEIDSVIKETVEKTATAIDIEEFK